MRYDRLIDCLIDLLSQIEVFSNRYVMLSPFGYSTLSIYLRTDPSNKKSDRSSDILLGSNNLLPLRLGF